MGRAESLINYMDNHNGKVTLGQILRDFQGESLGYKVTQAVSEARDVLKTKRKMTIDWSRGDTPSHGVYSYRSLKCRN